MTEYRMKVYTFEEYCKEVGGLKTHSPAMLKFMWEQLQPVTMRPEVMKFAEAMEKVLQENDWKGGWQDMSNEELMHRLEEETKELKLALCLDCPHCGRKLGPANGNGIESPKKEAVDVADFAMFIWDNATRKERQ